MARVTPHQHCLGLQGISLVLLEWMHERGSCLEGVLVVVSRVGRSLFSRHIYSEEHLVNELVILREPLARVIAILIHLTFQMNQRIDLS